MGINTEWGLLMASISEDNGEETPLQVTFLLFDLLKFIQMHLIYELYTPMNLGTLKRGGYIYRSCWSYSGICGSDNPCGQVVISRHASCIMLCVEDGILYI